MANLKQVLNPGDYFGPLAVWVTFFTFMFIFSVTVLNFCCVDKRDDKTVFQKWGSRHHIPRLGPHSDKDMLQIEKETK